MKTKTHLSLILVALLAYWVGLCNASAFYDPGTQRWLNRDPIAESGGVNLYEFVDDNPLEKIDYYGLDTSNGGDAPPSVSQPIVPTTCANSPSGCGAGNGPTIYPTSSCTIGDMTPYVTYTIPCPNGGTATCWKVLRCEVAYIAPTKGTSNHLKPIGAWKEHHHCHACPNSCPSPAS